RGPLGQLLDVAAQAVAEVSHHPALQREGEIPSPLSRTDRFVNGLQGGEGVVGKAGGPTDQRTDLPPFGRNHLVRVEPEIRKATGLPCRSTPFQPDGVRPARPIREERLPRLTVRQLFDDQIPALYLSQRPTSSGASRPAWA